MEEIEEQYPRTGEEYLNLIRKQYKMILNLQCEKDEYWKSITSISSPPYDKERIDGGLPNGTPEKVERYEAYAAQIQKEMDKLMRMRMEARQLIAKLSDPDMQLVLREYYIMVHSYREGCEALHMSTATFGRIHRTALLLFNPIYQRWINGKL